MVKPGALWLKEIMNKGQEKTQNCNSLLQTATKDYIVYIQPGKLAVQTGEFNCMLNYCDTF